MREFVKKSVHLVAATLALCAVAVPSIASAASWTAIGTHHTLDSPNIGFTSTTAVGAVVSSCSASSFTVNVASAANLEITSAAFSGCTAIVNGAAVCVTTLVPTRLPWTATAISTSNIQIHGVHLDGISHQSPAGTCPPALLGQVVTITGTVSGGTWNNPTHELVFNGAGGLVQHGISGTNLLTLTGTFRDTQQTLVVDN